MRMPMRYLLDNAARHGQAGSPIVVTTRRDREGAILAVEDRGPGIAPEDLPHVFEPFYRSARARRRGVPGGGLGLAVVARITAALGGSVAAEGEPSRGSRFTLRLPAAPAAVLTPAARTP